MLDAIPAGASRAVDVGSGDGLLAFDLADRGLRVIGLDVDLPSVRRAADAGCNSAVVTGSTAHRCAGRRLTPPPRCVR
ncbi:MAG: methyltransferase domain-containing protein [Acidimicrobiia bacterium]